MAKKKTTTDLKVDLIKLRSEEINRFYIELDEWCKERKVALSAEITISSGHNPNMVKIFIEDKL